jgi:hypothetical protein
MPALQSVAWPPHASRFRRSIRFASLELATPLFHTAALIAAFRCAAPTRCGGFADERRSYAHLLRNVASHFLR